MQPIPPDPTLTLTTSWHITLGLPFIAGLSTETLHVTPRNQCLGLPVLREQHTDLWRPGVKRHTSLSSLWPHVYRPGLG